MANEDAVDSVAGAIRAAETTVALTGAGVSTASGIPSFRGDDGIWDEYDPMAFHRRRFDADPAGFWHDRVDLRAEIYGDLDPRPNAAHEALASLERLGSLRTVLTQNIDGLHQDAGTENVTELHGTHRQVRCDDCGDRQPAAPVFDQVASGDVPPCCDCGGIYRPDVVLFGESLPDGVMETAQRRARESDVFLAVGSLLTVRPASLLPKIAARSGATLVVVNFEPTPEDGEATHVLRGDVTAVLPDIVARLTD